MLRKIITQLSKTFILLATVTSAHATVSSSSPEGFIQGVVLSVGAEPEGIRFNKLTGNYVIVYETLDVNGEPMLFKTEYVPPTKITPSSITNLSAQGELVSYQYEFANIRGSQQVIVSAEINVGDSQILPGSIVLPSSWDGGYVKKTINAVSWYLVSNKPLPGIGVGIPSGRSLTGFNFSSQNLPGVAPAKFRGRAPIISLAGEGPTGDLGNQLESILNNDAVVIYVSAPVINNPLPFNSVSVLENMKSHIGELTTSKYIAESLYISVVRVIDATIDAIQKSDMVTAKQFLDDLSVLIGASRPNDQTEIALEIIKPLTSSSQFNINYIKSRL